MNRAKNRASPSPQSAHLPLALGGYRVLGPLSPRKTFRAEAPGGAIVVLTMLPNHCLLKGELHPSIHERLSRVRELAEKGVANLHGVWRDRGYVYLVWDFLPGHTIGSERILKALTPREFLLLARELVLTVDSLHASGIVHGAIHANNVIVDAIRRLKLTHVTPLLYHDPSQDINAVVKLLRELLCIRNERATPLGLALARANSSEVSLQQLAAFIATLTDPAAPQPTTARRAPQPDPRRRALAAACVTAIAGASLSFALWHYARFAGETPLATPRKMIADQPQPAEPESP